MTQGQQPTTYDELRAHMRARQRQLEGIQVVSRACPDCKGLNGWITEGGDWFRCTHPNVPQPGTRLGRVTIKEYVGIVDRRSSFECQCICGERFVRSLMQLKTITADSFGCRNEECRFLWYVMKDTNSGCWLWTGGADKDGYGWFRRNGQEGGTARAHVYSYEKHIGPVGDLFVLHKCDTPACINPDHLFLGTAADNTADCNAKMRHVFGERVNTAKLPESIVRQIYAAEGGYREIGERFGVSAQYVWSVKHRWTWKHLEFSEPPVLSSTNKERGIRQRAAGTYKIRGKRARGENAAHPEGQST